MPKIIIDDAIPYIKGVLEPLCDVEYMDGREISAGNIGDADALMVRTRTRCDPALLSGSNVKAITTATAGYDHIDTGWCAAAGIEVFTAAGSNARGVLQWLGAVLAYDSDRQGWHPGEKTLGVVGTGCVGSLSALYGKLWGFEVLCCDPPREASGLPAPVAGGYVSLETIARESDIITLHTPLTFKGPHATYHMAGKRFFDMLKPGELVINAARGEVVDTAAFSNALDGGRCRAAVDTWEYEPDIDRGLLSRTILGTPHIAGYTAQGKANATAMSVDSLACFFGFPLQGWYPPEVPKTEIRNISWEEMCATINGYLDIKSEDAVLRSDPSGFERYRTEYDYRQEYF